MIKIYVGTVLCQFKDTYVFIPDAREMWPLVITMAHRYKIVGHRLAWSYFERQDLRRTCFGHKKKDNQCNQKQGFRRSYFFGMCEHYFAICEFVLWTAGLTERSFAYMCVSSVPLFTDFFFYLLWFLYKTCFWHLLCLHACIHVYVCVLCVYLHVCARTRVCVCSCARAFIEWLYFVSRMQQKSVVILLMAKAMHSEKRNNNNIMHFLAKISKRGRKRKRE